MTATNKTLDAKAAEIQSAIRLVLLRDWHPIPTLVPEDEYDSYVGPIYRLLFSRPSRHDVAQALVEIERRSLGFDNVKPGALLPVADKLLAIDVFLQNQSTDPTLASGSSGAGHQPRHP